jgi:phosphinothricin acetyltransferase
MNVAIRRAERADLPALLEIYNHYVLNTHITFDVEPRTLAERELWFSHFGAHGRYQCFVSVAGSAAIGWASSHPFKDRAAYDTSVETSIYLAPDAGGKGLGRKLYATLLDALSREDVHRAFGGIAQPNEASVALHRSLGYSLVGTYGEVGRKFGRFWDVAWYQKPMP